MKRINFLSLLFCILVSIGATAAESEYKSVDEFKGSLPVNPERGIAIVEGDLNGDGLSDRAILTGESNGETYELYILLQNQTGGYFLAQKAKQNGGFLLSARLTIEKGSLFVNMETLRPAGGATHQFKLYHGIWRLIGMRSNGVTGTTGDGGPATSGYDWNVITGKVVLSNDKTGKEINKRSNWTAEICRLEEYDFDPQFCTPSTRKLNY